MRDYIAKVVAAIDIPDKFYITAHSWGCYLVMMLGSMYPERIESMFLMSPWGTNSYDPLSYD